MIILPEKISYTAIKIYIYIYTWTKNTQVPITDAQNLLLMAGYPQGHNTDSNWIQKSPSAD